MPTISAITMRSGGNTLLNILTIQDTKSTQTPVANVRDCGKDTDMSNLKIHILYERLSVEDEKNGESNSITAQRNLLEQYAERNGFIPFIHISEMMFLSLIRNPSDIIPVICNKSPKIKASKGCATPTTEAFINSDLIQREPITVRLMGKLHPACTIDTIIKRLGNIKMLM